jgi:hypothetical protein
MVIFPLAYREESCVAVVSRDIAGKWFGSVSGAVGNHYRMQHGARFQVVGVVEDGKYLSLTEGQQPAIFLPYLQSPSGPMCLVVRSRRDPRELAAAIRSKLRDTDTGLAVETETWNSLLNVVLFPSPVATVPLGVLGMIALCCRSQASLEWLRTRSAGG